MGARLRSGQHGISSELNSGSCREDFQGSHGHLLSPVDDDHTYVFLYIYNYTYIHIHIYIYTCTHIHTHIYIYMQKFNPKPDSQAHPPPPPPPPHQGFRPNRASGRFGISFRVQGLGLGFRV